MKPTRSFNTGSAARRAALERAAKRAGRGARTDGAGAGTSRWMRLRVVLISGLFLALLLTVFSRAVYLQVVQRDHLRGMAQDQYVRQLEIPAKRGDIFDRRGIPLAQSVEVDSIWIDPSALTDVRGAAKELAKALHLDAEDLAGKLGKAKRFAWVKRQVTPRDVDAAKATELPGLGYAKEPRRFYPQRELAGQVLGVVGMDGKGLEGLELAFDDELAGQNEALPGFRDARGRKLLMQSGTTPIGRQGASVTLTIDRHLQYLSEKALGKAVEDSKALSGMAVALDPKTGAVLALAHYPRFNPNAPQGVTTGMIRDRAALDAYEPGSTFKAFVVAAALEENAVRPDQEFFLEKGHFEIGRHVIHEAHPFTEESMTPADILKHSSNVGAAKIGGALGRDRLVAYFNKFGFGEKTGLSLPGEAKGSLPYPKAEIQLATQSFGQGVSVTAVQLAAAYGALANGGVLMRPFLVEKAVDADGVVLVQNAPTPVRRVVSAPTALAVTRMLEGVVQKDGSAPRAHMDSYRVAGKTGTAQKVDPVARGYSDKHIASFAGMVPAEDPRLVILVVIDEPKTDVFGGLIAAPAFREIAEGAMPYLGVAPSQVQPLVAAAPKKLPNPKPILVKEEPPAQAVTERDEEGNVTVPPLEGRVGRDAVAKLLSVALQPRLLGSGRVVSQTPAPGTLVSKGTRVTLEMAVRP